MSYQVEAFIEGMMEEGHSGTLPELIAISKAERETAGERKDEGEPTPEEKQEKAERTLGGYVIPTELI